MDGEAPAQPDPAVADAAGAPPVEGEAPPVGDPNAPAGGLKLGEDGLPVKEEEEKKDEVIPPEIL